MASANVSSRAPVFSEYYSSLSGPEKVRYKEKIDVCGFDPYSLKNSDFDDDPGRLPTVEYPDIVNYLVLQTSWATKQQMKAYKSMEAYNIFVSDWVNKLQTKQVGIDKSVVFARINHSQRARETPLKTWFVAENDGNVVFAHCNCMAGLSEACSHVGALLFAVEAAVRIKGSVTCTQEKSKWVMPTYVKQVPYIPICEMDFKSAKTKHKQLVANQASPKTMPSLANQGNMSIIPVPSSQEQLKFCTNIAASFAKPAVLSLVPDLNKPFIPKDTNTLPKTLSSLFNEDNVGLTHDQLLSRCDSISLALTETDSKNIEFATRKQSSSPVWYEQRRGRITASRLHAVCHTSIEKPSICLIKAISYPEAHRFSSEATKWGLKHESTAREAYEETVCVDHEGLLVSESGFQINPKWPYMGASPDGVVKCNCCGKGLCEIKCPYSHRNETISQAVGSKNFCLEEHDKNVRLKRNHAYYYQIQMQMFVTGTDFCDFVVWTCRDIFIERIIPDDDFWRTAVAKATSFFKKCILPELVGKWYTRPYALQGSSAMSDESDDSDGEWCLCQQYLPDSQLIGCDNSSCPVMWYHMTCLGLSQVPEGHWICPSCQNL